MLVSENLKGPQLLTRLPELKSAGALIVSLEVGKQNSDWILYYHTRERTQPLPTQAELLCLDTARASQKF